MFLVCCYARHKYTLWILWLLRDSRWHKKIETIGKSNVIIMLDVTFAYGYVWTVGKVSVLRIKNFGAIMQFIGFNLGLKIICALYYLRLIAQGI